MQSSTIHPRVSGTTASSNHTPWPFWKRALVVHAVASLLGIFMGLFWHFKLLARGMPSHWLDVTLPDFFFWNLWALLWPVYLRLAKWTLSGNKGRWWSLLVHLVLAFVWPILGTVILTTATYSFTHLGDPNFLAGLDVALNGPIRGYYIQGTGFVMGFVNYLLTMAVASAYVYYQQFREAQVQNLRLETQLMTAQVQALRMQLHPHFFFNTLNSISSLLQVDPKAADRMVTQLGDLWRITVAHADVPMVSLDEELQFLRSYLAIEQVRFQDRLTVTFDASPNVQQATVPNLILQPLVENAIHHGISKRIAPGWIRVEASHENDTLVLRVCDSGPGIPLALVGDDLLFEAGIGLSNTRARLHQLYGEDGQITMQNLEAGGCCATLRFPYSLHVQPASV